MRSQLRTPKSRLVLGLEDITWEKAESLVSDTNEWVGMYRIDSLAHSYGWEEAIGRIRRLGSYTMADVKLHDTPYKVYEDVEELVGYYPSFITVHASGGPEMLEASARARDAGRESIIDPFIVPQRKQIAGVLAATVLTSISDEHCQSIYGETVDRQVLKLTDMAAEAGLDGIICSAKEVSTIRKSSAYDDMIVAVASITPSSTKKPPEQKRSGTPKQAIEDGADLLFLGRRNRYPEQGLHPGTAARRVYEEIEPAHNQLLQKVRPLAKRARNRIVVRGEVSNDSEQTEEANAQTEVGNDTARSLIL